MLTHERRVDLLVTPRIVSPLPVCRDERLEVDVDGGPSLVHIHRSTLLCLAFEHWGRPIHIRCTRRYLTQRDGAHLFIKGRPIVCETQYKYAGILSENVCLSLAGGRFRCKTGIRYLAEEERTVKSQNKLYYRDPDT